jgi:hypothetical protein
MMLPFNLFIADILRSVEDGFRFYEKVWTPNDQGKIVYCKLTPRDALTIPFKRDSNGGFAGAKQCTWGR